jgi:enamine deaminase RidA (YjgF/YER057c/UK114 family)
MDRVSEKIIALGIDVKNQNKAVANYVPYKIVGNMVYIAGQTCRENGVMVYKGKVGQDYDIITGQQAAKLCGINILSNLGTSINYQWEKVVSCVSLTVFVQSANNFYDQALIANGVSDLMVDVFGDIGQAVRVAVGVNTLPSNSAVEVAGIFEILI